MVVGKKINNFFSRWHYMGWARSGGPGKLSLQLENRCYVYVKDHVPTMTLFIFIKEKKNYFFLPLAILTMKIETETDREGIEKKTSQRQKNYRGILPFFKKKKKYLGKSSGFFRMHVRVYHHFLSFVFYFCIF